MIDWTKAVRRAALRGCSILLLGTLVGRSLLLAANAGSASQVIGEMTEHTIVMGDTMVEIARTYGVGFIELRAANAEMDPWSLIENDRLVVPTAHIVPHALDTGITINLGDFRLYYVSQEGEIYSWPIGIGRAGYETPMGFLTVTEKRRRPIWRPTKKQREVNPDLPIEVPSGPDNPLGDYALRVGWAGYAIHGTNKPDGIGRRVSGGCIRMYPEHIAELFDLVTVNENVLITDQAIKFGWRNDALYFEAHPSGNRADQVEETGEFAPYEPQDVLGLALEAAGLQLNRVNWHTIETALSERKGTPVRVTP